MSTTTLGMMYHSGSFGTRDCSSGVSVRLLSGNFLGRYLCHYRLAVFAGSVKFPIPIIDHGRIDIEFPLAAFSRACALEPICETISGTDVGSEAGDATELGAAIE